MDERIDERFRNVAEHRADGLFKELRREFVGKLELDLASVGGERRKAPFALQMPEWAVPQRDHDRFAGAVHVVGREMSTDTMIIDVDAGRLFAVVRRGDSCASAPRQKLRIEFDPIDKLEHCLGGIGHEHRLSYALHDVVARMRDARRGSIGVAMSIVDNKKAYHDYFIEEKFEAGVGLLGWEVKAIRAGRAQIKEAYIVVKNGEIVLIGAHITPLISASTHIVADPTRTRRLLLHRREINRLVGQVERAGYTLVPLNLHFSKGRIKLDLGLAKGKKQYDKRATIKEREWNREQQRLMRNRTGTARSARGV